jgi:PiT family inorganic phosphate transporter
MEATLVLVIGVLASVFVGINIGGSSTAAAFGPSVGSGVLAKAVAGGLMTVFVFVGGWTVGRRVVRTLSGGIVPESTFTLQAGVVVLAFVGLSLLIGNWLGIPASTSETTVGAIVGLGLATGTLQTGKILEIVGWWVVSPVLALLAAAAVGRFAYAGIERRLTDGDGIDSQVVRVERDGWRPYIDVTADMTERQGILVAATVLVGCYMAFSAGASNVANAVAPVVGRGGLAVGPGIVLATAAIGIGAFTLARRTLDVLDSDLANLPLVGALVVELIAASFITGLSAIGIPASLAITSTCTIIGLNWGRSRRRARTQTRSQVATDGGTDGEELLDTGTTWRSVGVWVLTPTLSAVTTYAVFSVL